MEAAAQQLGVRPDGLAAPPLPGMIAHVWDWFCELARCPGGIGYAEIKSWSELTGVRPSAFEVECLMQMGTAYSNPQE